MIHVVKGRQYSVYIVYIDASIAGREAIYMRPTFDLGSDKFQCFIHSDELGSSMYTASEFQIGHGMAC